MTTGKANPAFREWRRTWRHSVPGEQERAFYALFSMPEDQRRAIEAGIDPEILSLWREIAELHETARAHLSAIMQHPPRARRYVNKLVDRHRRAAQMEEERDALALALVDDDD